MATKQTGFPAHIIEIQKEFLLKRIGKMTMGSGKGFVGWPTNWHLKLFVLQNGSLRLEYQWN